MKKIFFLLMLIVLLSFGIANASGQSIPYFEDFNSQGSWYISSPKISIDDTNSKLYWKTDATSIQAYDSVIGTSKIGDIIEFEYVYLNHNDPNTRQAVSFGFTDEMPFYSYNSDGIYHGTSNNFIGGVVTNAWGKLEFNVIIQKEGKILVRTIDYPANGVSKIYKITIEILDDQNFQVTILRDGILAYDNTINEDMTGLSFNKFAVWNQQLTQTWPIQGSYEGELNYVSYLIDKINVAIDIKPGSDSNSFNNNGHGVIPVAIIGSKDLDVKEIDVGSVTLEGMAIRAIGKNNKLPAHYEDVNGDTILDLVVQIEDTESTFTLGDTTATLTGVLLDGTPIEGQDLIRIVPNKI